MKTKTTHNTQNLLKLNPKWLTKKSEKTLRASVIEAKQEALIKALKIPPAINQFNYHLNTEDFDTIKTVLSKYKPETRFEHKKRLYEFKQNNNKYLTEKKMFVKKGVKHITKLIEQKKLSLVLIASDVNPIELVLFLPTLCKKMGISYAFVKNQHLLGEIVDKKRVTVVGIEDVGTPEFKNIIKLVDSQFSERYEFMMKTWGNDESGNKVQIEE
ncbi:60S ribosomal protein L8 [Cucumispora dikerogammari]|nr:60S ribosomal protein L8 [Cucumispora dikerogammari]